MHILHTVYAPYTCTCVHVHVCAVKHTCTSEFLIGFEVWAKLAQQWLACVPLGRYLESINKELVLLVII